MGTIRVEPLDATFGALVHDVVLPRASDTTIAELTELWLEYALLVFPGQHMNQHEQDEFARRFGRPGRADLGLCLGAIPVADAGLLAGRRAVTHWQAFDSLAARHPDVPLDQSVLYIDHGDVLTSAGTASALDACLHVVRSRLGAEAANRVARSLVIAPHMRAVRRSTSSGRCHSAQRMTRSRDCWNGRWAAWVNPSRLTGSRPRRI